MVMSFSKSCSIIFILIIVAINNCSCAIDTTFYKKYTEYLNDKQGSLLKEVYGQPEQIHINYGRKMSSTKNFLKLH